jgi:hypothetical protein
MAEATQIIRLVIDSSKAVEGSAAATRALEKLERSTASMDGALSRMEKGLASVGLMVKAHLALMVVELGARFVQMGKDSLNAVAGLDELSEQLGITTTGLQALQFSAVQNGVKLEQLETYISKFSQKMGDAANGSKDMVDALNAIGVKNLDVQGKLRPTEALLQDVAEAITKIDDPARRSAAAVDFFGKAGSRMLPMLADIASGTDAMAAAAKAGGAMIDASIIKSLDKMSDEAEKSGLKMRALFAEIAAPIITEGLERVNGLLGGIADQLARGKASGQGFWATVLNDSKAQGQIGSGPGALKLATPAEMEAYRRAQLQAELKNPASVGREQMIQEEIDRLNQGGLRDRQSEMQSQEDWARRIPLPGSGALPGVSTSIVKSTGGDSVADRRQKALQDSQRELDAARAFAAASNDGALAVANLETHFKALKTAQDVFGKTAEQNGQGVKALTAQLEAAAQATERAKNIKDLNLGTVELEKANELLAAENRLINATVETRAIEIAQIKLKQDLQAKGITGDTEEERRAIERRSIALETGERLKAQGEEIKKANELWTAPLKSALESIQQVGADAFEQMLTNGNFTFQSLGDTFKKIVIRMAAEFMALAMIRPVMTVMVNAVSPGMASSMGLGGGGGMSMPGLGGAGGGGGGFSMPSMGGGMFGSASDWTSSAGSGFSMPEFMGGSGSGSIAGFFGQNLYGGSAIAGPLQPGAASLGMSGGVSLGGALSGAMGIGMGAYTLATANGSTGKTISGVGQMIGGGMMLIPGMQIPGMIVTALATILPMLMPDAETRTHSSTNASLHYGNGDWYTTGGAYGANANSGQSESALRSLTGGIDSVFGLLGGVKDASKVWGLNASSWTAQGKDWSYTSNATHLVDPATGSQEAWRMNMGDMMDTGAAQVAIRSILSGAVGEISSTMKTALEAMRAAAMGIEETGKSIVFVDEVYERLGKGALTVRSQFRELENQFTEMTATAKRLGLSLAPIEAEQKKATERLGQDYIDNLIDPIAVGLRAWADEKASILANVDYIGKNTDVIVDMARINEALLRKEATLKEQLYGGAISQLEDAIKRLLPGGNLANVDPSGTLAGLQATYQSTYAQASAGDAAAIGRFGGEASSYAEYAQSYFAGSPEYNAIKLQIVEALQTVQAAAMGPSVQADGTPSSASNANGAQMQQLLGTVNNLIAELQQERQESAKLRAVLSRYVTTQAA